MEIFKSIPRTIEEAIKQVLSGWPEAEKHSFQALKPEELFDLRNTLGADIRNVFSLWYGNDDLLLACDKYLSENYEAYSKPFQVKINQWKQEEKDENLDLDKEEDEETEEYHFLDENDPNLLSLDIFTKSQKTSIDPYIASQVIIFAIWKYLQEEKPTL